MEDKNQVLKVRWIPFPEIDSFPGNMPFTGNSQRLFYWLMATFLGGVNHMPKCLFELTHMKMKECRHQQLQSLHNFQLKFASNCSFCLKMP